jgi:AraC family L-rhamnose operon transcriptional activator RhaR
MPLHSHRDYFQLMVIVSGGGMGLVQRARFPLRIGQLLFLRPGRAHGLQAGPQGTLRTLDTKFRIRHRVLREACRRLPAVLAEPDRRIVPLLEAMHAEAQRAGQLSAEICGTLLTQILLFLLQHGAKRVTSAVPYADAASEHDLGGRVHRFLSDHCDAKITQRSLSQTFRYSYRHLHALYRRGHGESPLHALKRLRVERAKQLIHYSDYELKQIAKLTGFATVHHFTRVFTSHVGTSPARWRDQDSIARRRELVIHPGFVNKHLVNSEANRPQLDLPVG